MVTIDVVDQGCIQQYTVLCPRSVGFPTKSSRNSYYASGTLVPVVGSAGRGPSHWDGTDRSTGGVLVGG